MIGLGSMGKRRIRLLKKIDDSIEIVGVDSREDRRQETVELYGAVAVETLDEAIKLQPSVGFVCTSPLSHSAIITQCLNNGISVFSEINLVSDGYDENIELARTKKLTLFLSSTFLYRDEIRYICTEVQNSKSCLSYMYHVGQYLPDWHPWELYTEYFVGDKRTNGCRELLAIELPWIITTFGNIVDVKVLKGKKTNLKVNYPDCFMLLLTHSNGMQGTFVVDVVSRKAVRNLEIFGEDLYISWDGTPSGLMKYNYDSKENELVLLYDNVDKTDGYASFIIENAYRAEIESFLEVLKSGTSNLYGFEDDIETLKLIDLIESDA